jgi:hypothetical protein
MADLSVDGQWLWQSLMTMADRDRPLVGLGSHFDSQATGGQFDGAVSVLAALKVTPHPQRSWSRDRDLVLRPVPERLRAQVRRKCLP